jgi:hypothetical protein
MHDLIMIGSFFGVSQCTIFTDPPSVLVYDYTPWVPGQVPPPMDEFVEFTPSLQHYKPVLWINDYWNLNKGKRQLIQNS